MSAVEARIWSSAPAIPSGLRVNCTPEASARNSRCRDTAALITRAKNRPDVADDEERQADSEYASRARPPCSPAFGYRAHDETADRADEHDAGEHADHPDVEPHVAVQDVAELVADHALQLVAVERLQRARA